MAASSEPEDPWVKKTLLSLDGGGVRGYSSLLILEALMKEIAIIERQDQPGAVNSVYPLTRRPRTPLHLRESKNRNITVYGRLASSHYFPCHYFDYVAGSSTGGLIAIMLGRLSMTVEECLEAYETLSVKAFGKPRRFHFKNCWIPRNKYDHGPLEDAIREVVELRCGQANAILNQPKKDMCRTIIVAWKESYNEIERRPYLFRSYRHPAGGGYPEERNPDGRTEYPIWQVARATSACPPYFKSMALEGEKNEDYRFVDGGLGANNPSEEAWGSVRQLNQDRPDTVQVLLSVGTGHRVGSKRRPDTFYNNMRSLFDTAKDSVTDTFRVHESVMKQMRSNGYYCRLTARGIEKIKLDTCEGKGGEETFALMRKKTDAYLKTADVKKEIQECARKLVAIRRARSGSWDLDRWERYCYGVEYACSLGNCNYSEKRFKRQKLHQHMNESHDGKFSRDHIDSLLDKSKKFPLYEPTPS